MKQELTEELRHAAELKGILDLQVGVEVNRLVVCSAQYERIGWGESQRPPQWTWSG